MTMMMTNSQFGLDDMEVLLWGPSSPMADPMGSLFFHTDQEEQQGGSASEGGTSPASPLTSSLSSSSSPPPFYSPPPSPDTNLIPGDKVGSESDLFSIPWLDHPGQLRSHVVSDDSKENAFGDLDWMAERVDLGDFDLDSLIGSCSPAEDPPSSPEDLLASLDCSMQFDSIPVTTLQSPVHTSLTSASLSEMVPYEHSTLEKTTDPASPVYSQEVPSSPPCVPEPQEELEIKSEPASPEPSSPAYTLELGSEVDVSESEVEMTEVVEVKPVVAPVIPQIPRFVVSLSPTRIVLVLAPKEDLTITTNTTVSTATEASEPAPATRSSRSRPYHESKYKAGPSSPRGASVKVRSPHSSAEERVQLKAPRDKKLKKMEQNKTAATRYRQKKRAEQEALLDEYAILERKNMELTEKAESMAREIQYLKELMEEVRLTRIKKGLSADP